jgi:hypothetical protein
VFLHLKSLLSDKKNSAFKINYNLPFACRPYGTFLFSIKYLFYQDLAPNRASPVKNFILVENVIYNKILSPVGKK